MSVRISGKHMDIGDAFRTRIGDRLDQSVSKYFDGNFTGTVVVSKAGARFSTDCMLHLDSGVVFQATGEAHDPEASFADAATRVEKRLRRYKGRLKDHHGGTGAQREVAYAVVAPLQGDDEEGEVPEDYAPAIVAETSLKIGTMSVANAVMELDRRDGPVVVFRNAGSGEINIVYRRTDGNFGWVDPSTYKTGA